MHKTPLVVAGIVFTLVALLHIWRLATGEMIVIGTEVLPLWANVVGLIISALLAAWMFKAAGCCYSCCSHKHDMDKRNDNRRNDNDIDRRNDNDNRRNGNGNLR